MASKKGNDARRGNGGDGGGSGSNDPRGVGRLARQAAEGTLLYETKNPLARWAGWCST